MLKMNWRRVATVWLAGLGAAGRLAAQESPKTEPPPAGPTLAFDAETKDYNADAEETSAPFTFYATNVWTNAIVIQDVYPSCHCTVATLPDYPWVLAPGASGAIKAQVELANGDTEIIKTLTLVTSVGERSLTLQVSVAPPLKPPGPPLTAAERQAARVKAAADAKAIFHGDCAKCHSDRTRGLLDRKLYEAACGICHDSPQRAKEVPDLRALKQPTDLDYWMRIIDRGKPHTLMPGFAEAEGGPLTEMQASSLAAYLDKALPTHPPAR